MSVKKRELLGVIPEERIKTLEIERPSKKVIEDFIKISDMSGSTARALDTLGYESTIPSSTLRPLIEGRKIVGPAITVRDVPSRISRYYGIVTGAPSYQKGEVEAYFLAEPGDVIVIDAGGMSGASSMGSISAFEGKSRGMAGSIVDGWCTGVPGIREVDYPVWCRGGTTKTGHHRLETIEINGVIQCGGVQVRPGDLIVADDTGISVIPCREIERVLDIVKRSEVRTREKELIKSGASPSEIGKEIAKHGRDDKLLTR
jgi:regulator of RNase E activity RraA